MNAIWKELLGASLIESVYMALLKAFGSQDPCGVDATPRWSWQCSLSFQLFFFPLLCYLAWKEDGELPLDAWLVLPWPADVPHTEARPGIRMFLAAFVGYMVKDMWPFLLKIGLMYWLHHFVSLFLCFCFLFGDLPPALFVLGAMLAEFGSAFMNMHAMGWWKEYRYARVALLGMTLSNLGTCYMMYPLNTHPQMAPYVTMRWSINVVITALCAERQRFAYNTYLTDEKKFRKAHKKA